MTLTGATKTKPEPTRPETSQNRCKVDCCYLFLIRKLGRRRRAKVVC